MNFKTKYHTQLTNCFKLYEFPQNVKQLNLKEIQRLFQHPQDYYSYLCFILYRAFKKKKHILKHAKSAPNSITQEKCQKNNSIPDAKKNCPDTGNVNGSKVVKVSSTNDGSPQRRSETYGDLQQKKTCMYQHSSIKKILKRIYLKSHPDKVKDKFKNYLFVKANKAFQHQKLYKLLFVCRLLNIRVCANQFNKMQPIFQNEVLLLYHACL